MSVTVWKSGLVELHCLAVIAMPCVAPESLENDSAQSLLDCTAFITFTNQTNQFNRTESDFKSYSVIDSFAQYNLKCDINSK